MKKIPTVELKSVTRSYTINKRRTIIIEEHNLNKIEDKSNKARNTRNFCIDIGPSKCDNVPLLQIPSFINKQERRIKIEEKEAENIEAEDINEEQLKTCIICFEEFKNDQ